MYNFYKTAVMIAALSQIQKRKTFLRDRYFPCNTDTDIFPSEEVLIEIKKGNKKIAPCVMPRKNGITMEREGFSTYRYTPPFIAPQRVLTIDDLNSKGFGESLYSNKTPEQRQAEVLRTDLTELDEMISGREEEMVSQVLQTNSLVLKQYADKYGEGEYDEFEIRFYENDDETLYTPSVCWNEANADILGDLKAMVRMLTSKGLPVSELIVAPDVADIITNNSTIQKLLDLRNINIGNITPLELAGGASHIGTLNINGRMIKIISYDETYTDESGVTKQYIKSGNVILTSPECGRLLYGAVSQIESADGNFHTYTSNRVPKYISNENSDVRTLKLSAKPLPIPRNYNAWVHADVIK